MHYEDCPWPEQECVCDDIDADRADGYDPAEPWMEDHLT
jgi:hypothetical protein